jgi:hypothetical protein
LIETDVYLVNRSNFNRSDILMSDDSYRHTVQVKKMMSSYVSHLKQFGLLLPKYRFHCDSNASNSVRLVSTRSLLGLEQERGLLILSGQLLS